MKISIITICYNNIEGLKQTFNSVDSQTVRKQFEYIIVDGASADGTADFLESCGGRVDKWVSEKDSGIYNAMNKGVSMATGDYCLFLNSGDVLHDDNVISDILGYLENEDLIIGKIVFLNNMSTSVVESPITFKRLYVGSLPHPATFIKTDLLRKYPYDESLRIVSDWKFFLQTVILNNCSYKIIDRIVSDFDCDGISGVNRDLCDRERASVLKEMFPERIILDYFRNLKGEGYQDTTYDNFYIKMRDYAYGKYLYSLNVMIMKFISLFRKGAKFARNYPTKLS